MLNRTPPKNRAAVGTVTLSDHKLITKVTRKSDLMSTFLSLGFDRERWMIKQLRT